MLEVRDSDLPEAVSGLLALYVEQLEKETAAGGDDVIRKWLSQEPDVSVADAARVLGTLGWDEPELFVAAVEPMRAEAAKDLGELSALFGELLDEGRGYVGATTSRLYLLLAPQAGTSVRDELRAWLDTAGAELYVPLRAGLARAAGFRDIARAREEAEFALEAGKRFRSQEAIHEHDRLGLARLLHGLPQEVKEAFVCEVLPGDVLASLSPELRETIFAFLEHGQQVADTARSLYIHRNTLLYRLDRICELTGYEIRKPLQGWTLWLALTLSRTE